LSDTKAADDTSGDNNCPKHLRLTAIWKEYGIEGSAVYHSVNIPVGKGVDMQRKKGHTSKEYTLTNSSGISIILRGRENVADFLKVSLAALGRELVKETSIEYKGYIITLEGHESIQMPLFLISRGGLHIQKRGVADLACTIGLGVSATRKRLIKGKGFMKHNDFLVQTIVREVVG
jgi:hypothetical protein